MNVLQTTVLVEGKPTMKATLFICSALSAAIWAGAVIAGTVSYNGNWPLTVSHSQVSNGSYCLTLNGSTSGSVSLTGPGGLNVTEGNFQVIGSRLIASAAEPTGSGFNEGLVFDLRAANGNLAKGPYFQDYSGYLNDTGVATVGTKNGC
ncbi:MAG TPA: hypothetical protein VHT03_04955 [Rhizomicrobium sp.]|jgi:hypothetical protein|nr:hypothetical protein [Rhizomicrobium sp.]